MKVISFFGTSIVTAMGSSLCCIVPALSLMAGTSSIATSLTWIQPLRPYFISTAVLVLGFAWYGVLFSKKETNCNCETIPKTTLFKTKKLLSIVTLVSILLITFPSYSHFFFNDKPVFGQSTLNQSTIIPVTGMTCNGCEMHIEDELKKLQGIIVVKASHVDETTAVEYDNSKVSIEQIVEAINRTGYKASKPKTENGSDN